VLPDGALAVENGVPIGHVTSSYRSPTLGRSIALGLIAGGRGRMGSVLRFPLGEGRTLTARVVDPVFHDPEGSRQNV
jgi:sarcosine oxidase subunit alpha